MRVSCTVNGERMVADDVWEGESLLFVLRERLGLPGSKNACEQGECGSCTVVMDGGTVCACLVAAGQAQGRDIQTVEGLATIGAVHGLPHPHDPGHAADAAGHPGVPGSARALRAARGRPPISSTPAIVAAIRAATGRPLTRVPVRPEDITGT